MRLEPPEQTCKNKATSRENNILAFSEASLDIEHMLQGKVKQTYSGLRGNDIKISKLASQLEKLAQRHGLKVYDAHSLFGEFNPDYIFICTDDNKTIASYLRDVIKHRLLREELVPLGKGISTKIKDSIVPDVDLDESGLLSYEKKDAPSHGYGRAYFTLAFLGDKMANQKKRFDVNKGHYLDLLYDILKKNDVRVWFTTFGEHGIPADLDSRKLREFRRRIDNFYSHHEKTHRVASFERKQILDLIDIYVATMKQKLLSRPKRHEKEYVVQNLRDTLIQLNNDEVRKHIQYLVLVPAK